jgi:hypothetical protein
VGLHQQAPDTPESKAATEEEKGAEGVASEHSRMGSQRK